MDRQELEELYLRRHLTMDEIGKMYGKTRQCIYLWVKKLGLEKRYAEKFKVKCDKCGKEYETHRGRYRKSSTHYCSIECYLSDRKNTHYKPHRNGQREARAIMSKHIGRALTKDEIVHHIDGNCSNNSIDNLVLFPSQSAHFKWHHSLRIKQYEV
jgi:hypothetical protein